MKLITVSLLAAAGILSAGMAQAADESALAKSKNCLDLSPGRQEVAGPSYGRRQRSA